jgi:nicotinate-nucleotide adenylyltransferase
MEPVVTGIPPTAFAPQRIGLLGGSFNPAHEGHLHISREAMKRLQLDRVWWLVSPHNPLKPAADLAPFAKRLAGAVHLAEGAPIDVLDFEEVRGLKFTVDTLSALRRAYPRVRFVWLMGADCLAEFPAWKDWQRIFEAVPIAVFARPGYSMRALSGMAAGRFRRFRVPAAKAEGLSERKAPAWTFLEGLQVEASATAIRAKAKKR